MILKGVVIGITLSFLCTNPVLAFERTSFSISSGHTLYVGGSGPGNYSKIQDAIDKASDGDTVYVYHGIYYEHLTIKKSITVIGENRNDTIIDGSGSTKVAYIYATGATLANFTIQNASGDWCYGIYLDYDSHITIQDNIITNLKGSWANGIGIFDGLNNTIIGNTIANLQGTWLNGLEINHESNDTIIRNYITNLDGLTDSVGINLESCSSKERISQNVISSSGRGIVIYAKSNHNSISQNIISTAHNGISTRFLSSNNTIFNNTISSSEDGIFCERNSSNNLITKNNIIINSTEGIGIDLEGTSNNNIIISNNILIVGNVVGISSYLSANTTIKNNSITIIHEIGILVGIQLDHAITTVVEGNTIDNCSLGIYIYNSNNNSIRDNNVSHCRSHFNSDPVFRKMMGCSIFLLNGTFNTISGNILLGNDKAPSFIFMHALKEGESFFPFLIPNSYKAIRLQEDLSNTWSQNHFSRSRFFPRIISGSLFVYSPVKHVLIYKKILINHEINPRGFIE